METNTILLLFNLTISALTVCQRSRCTDIEISDCIKIRRDVPDAEEDAPPVYGQPQ
jgi:hypothetical protein